MLALLQIQRWRANARNVSFRTIFRCLIHIINSFDKMTKFCCKSYYLEQHHSFLETYPFYSLGSNRFEWSNVRYVFTGPDFVNFRKVRNTLCCFPISQSTSNTSQIERRFARDRTWRMTTVNGLCFCDVIVSMTNYLNIYYFPFTFGKGFVV